MTTTPTNSTVSAEQAIADVHAICDGLADVHTEKVPAMHRLFAFIAQHSTEPVAAGWRLLDVGERMRDGDEFWREGEDSDWMPTHTRWGIGAIVQDDDPPIRRRFAVQGQSGAKVSRYPWKDAPEWAKLAATNADGQRLWYGGPEVYQRETYWDYYGRASRMPDLGKPCPDWRDSLEQRPTGETK
jgi:hypothetical protein